MIPRSASTRRSLTRRVAGALAALAALVLAACAEDTILPVDFNCGDGVVAGPEECDVAGSAGCLECRLTVGWECTDAECHTVCGDGVVAGDEQCDTDDLTVCDSACRAGARPARCDMTGWWISRQKDFSIAVGNVQTSSNWYVFRLSQTGDDVRVEENLNCGITVTGTVNVNLTPEGTLGLMHINRQDAAGPQGQRRGVSRETPTGCDFTFERWYYVRGGELSLLPDDFRTLPSMDELDAAEPLPSEVDPENPTGANLTGQADTDADGIPGLTWHVSGNARGKRGTVQRDWAEYWSAPGFEVPHNALEFTVRSDFDNSENILETVDCPLLGCGILTASSTPSPTLNHRVTFRYLGAALTEPRVAAVVGGPPRVDDATDVATCLAALATLPHDPASE